MNKKNKFTKAHDEKWTTGFYGRMILEIHYLKTNYAINNVI